MGGRKGQPRGAASRPAGSGDGGSVTREFGVCNDREATSRDGQLLQRLFSCRVNLGAAGALKPRLRPRIWQETVYAEGL